MSKDLVEKTLEELQQGIKDLYKSDRYSIYLKTMSQQALLLKVPNNLYWELVSGRECEPAKPIVKGDFLNE